MEIYNLSTMKREERAVSPLSPESDRGFAVALGSFDGIHAGHVALITRAVSAARERGLYSAVWTFHDDASQLPGKTGTRVITTLKEKLGLIASLGVDYALLEDFSRVRDYSPEYFVNRLLKQDSHMRLAVCGFNFRFGKDRLGDSDTLCELMGSENCIIVPPVYRSGHLVSSSAIRLLISAGEMELAAQLLTRPFFIDFPVVHGKQLGRTIGIPTINQEFPEGHVIPKNGIYACTVEIADDIFLGVANVGVRPTVDHGPAHINCETHIINYNGWLYGKNIKVSFYKRIRDEIKFPSVDELRAQIKRDIASAIDYFSKK